MVPIVQKCLMSWRSSTRVCLDWDLGSWGESTCVKWLSSTGFGCLMWEWTQLDTRLSTASKTDWRQFEDRGYSAEEIYSQAGTPSPPAWWAKTPPPPLVKVRVTLYSWVTRVWNIIPLVMRRAKQHVSSQATWWCFFSSDTLQLPFILKIQLAAVR